MADCPMCRVCGHRHNSWFEDEKGAICDACLNGIPCDSEPDLDGDWSIKKPFPDAQIPLVIPEREGD